MDTILRTAKRGFTLIELLVVISIVALLISILLPALGAARERARQVKCGTQARQIAFAIMTYGTDHHGWFPLISHDYNNEFRHARNPGSIRSYLGQEGQVSEDNDAGSLAVALCPSRDERLRENYVNRLNGATLGTTYRIVAGRGNRDYLDDTKHSITDENYPSDGSGWWYGFLYRPAQFVTVRGSSATAVPRENMIGQIRVAGHSLPGTPTEQPMLADMFDGVTGEGVARIGSSGGSDGKHGMPPNHMGRHNHDAGVNTAFADGHVRWTGADDLQYWVQPYTNDTSRLWW